MIDNCTGCGKKLGTNYTINVVYSNGEPIEHIYEKRCLFCYKLNVIGRKKVGD